MQYARRQGIPVINVAESMYGEGVFEEEDSRKQEETEDSESTSDILTYDYD